MISLGHFAAVLTGRKHGDTRNLGTRILYTVQSRNEAYNNSAKIILKKLLSDQRGRRTIAS